MCIVISKIVSTKYVFIFENSVLHYKEDKNSKKSAIQGGQYYNKKNRLSKEINYVSWDISGHNL